MIDLHLHLLPGIDDGAASIKESREMLTAAHALGFRTVVPTPHLMERLRPDDQWRIAAALAAVAAEATPLGMRIDLGYEVALTPDLPARLEANEPITLAGSRAILVELPVVGWPTYTESTLFALQAAGYRPLLAHPERYRAVQQDPTLALDLVARGIMLQVTFASFVGLFGKAAKRSAETLLRHGAIHILASDAHSAGHRLAAVEKARARVVKLAGEQETRAMTVDNPLALLADRPLPIQSPLLDSGRGGWRSRLRLAFSRP